MGYPDWEPPGVVKTPGGGGKIAAAYKGLTPESHEIKAGVPFESAVNAEHDVFYCGTLRLLAQVTVPGGEANIAILAKIGAVTVGTYELDLGSNATFADNVTKQVVGLIIPKGLVLKLSFSNSQQTGSAIFTPTAALELD